AESTSQDVLAHNAKMANITKLMELNKTPEKLDDYVESLVATYAKAYPPEQQALVRTVINREMNVKYELQQFAEAIDENLTAEEIKKAIVDWQSPEAIHKRERMEKVTR